MRVFQGSRSELHGDQTSTSRSVLRLDKRHDVLSLDRRQESDGPSAPPFSGTSMSTASTTSSAVSAPSDLIGRGRNVTFIVIPAVVVPVVVIAMALCVYFVLRRRRAERHRRQVKELTTRPFSRIMTDPPKAVPINPPAPPTIIIDIRRSKYASTIVPVGADSVAPSSPGSLYTSFAEPQTPGGLSESVSTIAPGTRRSSVDSRYWSPAVAEVPPPVPDLPSEIKMRFPIQGIESRPPSTAPTSSPRASTVGGTTLRDSIDSRRWSAFSAGGAPPVPQLPPMSPLTAVTSNQQEVLAVPRSPLRLRAHSPPLPPLPVEQTLQSTSESPIDLNAGSPAPPPKDGTTMTDALVSPAVEPHQTTTPHPLVVASDGSLVTTALSPTPPLPVRRRTFFMERRQRRLNLVLADALVSPSTTPQSSVDFRLGGLPPPVAQRPRGPRSLSTSSSSSTDLAA